MNSTRKKAANDFSPKPYLLEFYNVELCTPGNTSLTRSTIGRLHNQIIQELNAKDHLPTLIVLLPDKEIIEEACFGGFGCKVVFEKSLNWLASNIKTALDIRKDDLKVKNAGALLDDISPHIVWIKMLTRPYISNTDKGYVFAQCNTYNEILSSMVSKFKNSLVMDIPFPQDRNLFDLTGRVTAVGKEMFWREFNRQFRRFDSQPSELSPSQPTQHISTHQPSQHIKHRLYNWNDSSKQGRHGYPEESDDNHKSYHVHTQHHKHKLFKGWSLERAYHQFDI